MARAGAVCKVDGCTQNAEISGFCTRHASEHERKRGSAARRGYDHRHRLKRARLMPRAYGRPCSICGRTMKRGQPIELHHLIALRDDRQATLSDLAHRSCNLGSDPPYDPEFDD